MTQCGFIKAWVGACQADKSTCEHKDVKCSSCGLPATHECHETGSFICGAPLCSDCEHVVFYDGTNGGVGFNERLFSTGHVKKSEQKHKPWYMRETKYPA